MNAAQLPLVAVVGRTNVGKSTLVNRMVGRREAIEHPQPGATRDRQGYAVQWAGRSFLVVDTGGWEPRAKGLAAKVVAQAEQAARQADVILFVVDAETGITSDDLQVARSLRRSNKTVVVVANKVDSSAREAELASFVRLGLGPAMPVSALHGRASGDLLDAVVAELPPKREEAEPDASIRVAIVGRPNVGKSSLFNRLVGAERAIVDETAGTTRDAVDEAVMIGGQRYVFVDTAGMRRRASTAQGPEYYGLVRSLRAIDQAEVAIIIVDASEGITEQDQRVARRVASAGRAAVLLLNKWDLLDERQQSRIEDDVQGEMRLIAWAPVIRTSALTGRGMKKVLPALQEARASWESRVPTATLNVWLQTALERIPLGSRGVAPPRVRYATQASACPPHAILFSTGQLPAPALRALERSFRERFGFQGTPVRFSVRVRKRER